MGETDGALAQLRSRCRSIYYVVYWTSPLPTPYGLNSEVVRLPVPQQVIRVGMNISIK